MPVQANMKAAMPSNFQRKMPEKYMVEDMEVAATFRSTEDSPHLKLVLIPISEFYDESMKQWVRKQDSGVRQVFKACLLRIKNKAIFDLLIKSTAFRQTSRGFDIDPTDPTGFWRNLKINGKPVIEVRPVPTTEKIMDKAEFDAIKPADITKAISSVSAATSVETEIEGPGGKVTKEKHPVDIEPLTASKAG